MIVYGETVALWMESALGEKFVPPFTAIGATDQTGAIIAGFVFNMYTRHDVEVSLVATRLPRGLMRAVYVYVVETLGCDRATFRTRADNEPAKSALIRLGAQLEGQQRGYFGDCDALLFGILKEEFPHGLHA